ncbi:MAG TPA: hypothetical protein VGD00_04485 [Solirubrobacteraceae bacterium]
MKIRTSAAAVAVSSFALMALNAPLAQANPLSLLPGSCGNQVESQPFARWGDTYKYTAVAGGTFEAGSLPWALFSGARVVSGNESYYVTAGTDRNSLSLPSGSSALSPAMCASIYHPTLRLFVRNTGSSSSRLRVEALYPALLGGVQSARIGEIGGASVWQPTPTLTLTAANLMATLSLQQTVLAYRFTPEDASGQWSVDDVYLDPRMR